MKQLTYSLALVLILTTAAHAETPVPGMMNFTLGGGINMPSGEETQNGYIVGGGVGYRLTPRLVIGGEVSYLGYGSTDGTSNSIDYSMDQHVFAYGGTARFFLTEGRTTPYVKGFAGRFNLSFDMTIGNESFGDSYTDMQYGGGIGLMLRGNSESNLYIEGLFHSLQVEDESAEVITVTMGMDIDFKL
jgi:opacity protein-like surface antigen